MCEDNMVENLSTETLYQKLKAYFPLKNDFGDSDYIEELKELRYFGIKTDDKLLSLLDKYSNKVLEIDREPLDEQHIKWYRADPTIDNLDDKIENKYWFSLSGLLRIMLELEFGEEYRKFASKRDGI